MLDDAARTLITRFPLGFVATVDAEGAPRVSPKGTFLALDDRTLGFGAIRSPGTLENLHADARTEVNFVDPFARKALRARGTARIFRRAEPEFTEMIPRWQDVWGDLAERISALVLIDVTEAEHITTPPYDDGVTEEEMVALYKSKFSEIYP